MRRARSIPNHYPSRWDAAAREHEAMQAALVARDGNRLSALLEPHHLNGLAAMRAAMQSVEDRANEAVADRFGPT
jgi:hypothetical protein